MAKKKFINNFTPTQLTTLSDVFRKRVIEETLKLEKNLASAIVNILETEGPKAAWEMVKNLHVISESGKFEAIDMLLVMVEVSDIGGPMGLAFATPYLEAEFAKYDLEIT